MESPFSDFEVEIAELKAKLQETTRNAQALWVALGALQAKYKLSDAEVEQITKEYINSPGGGS